MTARALLDLLVSQQDVRDYLRGIEEDSEADRAAQRAMLTAIGMMRGSGIRDVMAAEEPDEYATACLLRAQLLVDGVTGQEADSIMQQYNDIVLRMRYDPHNVEDEVTVNG